MSTRDPSYQLLIDRMGDILSSPSDVRLNGSSQCHFGDSIANEVW